jgi:acyl transferase domain-containing protein
MMYLNERSILERLKNNEISSEEAFKLIKRLREKKVRPASSDSPVKGQSPAVESPVVDLPQQHCQQDAAIIGISCQFPDANNVNEFWNNLAAGKNSITEIPEGRWEIDRNHPAAAPIKDAWWGAFMPNPDLFDPFFFNISPKEAGMMDPHQRLVLQEVWRALEDAGYSDKALNEKKCGVFIGCTLGEYMSRLRDQDVERDFYFYSGNSAAILPARVSYYLNLRGPAIPIDTACSSALTALHLAYEHICSGACDMAIAGGVMVLVTPNVHLLAAAAGMLSPTGQCKTFDDEADGFAAGEGIGIVILKSLDNALEDNDHIYGVIKGSGTNQDGKTSGISAPSSASQTQLECQVYDTFHLHPETFGFVETHGTGTKLGDPIEVDALTDAFRKYTDRKQFCAIGSVKTNIGHTQLAAGAASLIKVLMCFKHRQIPPSLNYKTPNRHINFKDSPFYVNTRLMDWQTNGKPRRALISSFGFSGTNVHMVLEEPPYPAQDKSIISRPWYLIAISAKTREALERKYQELLKWLEFNQDQSIGDIAYTLQMGRSHFSLRSALIVKDYQDLKQKIKEICQDKHTGEYWVNDLREAKSGPGIESRESGKQLTREIQEHDLDAGEYKEKLTRLSGLYVNGSDLDWSGIYHGNGYRRISMPAYPFAAERYWIPDPEPPRGIRAREAGYVQCTPLHPLLHRNTSNFQEQKFTTHLQGDEYFMAGHVVPDRRVLPALAYIEMVRAAGEIAANQPVHKIKTIVWANPMTTPLHSNIINICLYPHQDEATFEVNAGNNSDQSMVYVYAQGTLAYKKPGQVGNHPGNHPPDIKAFKTQCTHSLTSQDCYRWFQKKGLTYDPVFKTINHLYAAPNSVLSSLGLPREIKETAHGFVLHPSLLEGVLQTTLFLHDHTIPGEIKTKSLFYHPFILEEVKLVRPLPERCYCFVYAVRAENKPISSGQNTFAGLLLDEQGQELLKIKNFVIYQAHPLLAS